MIEMLHKASRMVQQVKMLAVKGRILEFCPWHLCGVRNLVCTPPQGKKEGNVISITKRKSTSRKGSGGIVVGGLGVQGYTGLCIESEIRLGYTVRPSRLYLRVYSQLTV